MSNNDHNDNDNKGPTLASSAAAVLGGPILPLRAHKLRQVEEHPSVVLMI